MKIDKVKGSYSEYKCTVSFGQLKALRDALAVDHSGPILDEMFKALDYYMSKLPLPGDDEDAKKAKEAEKAAEADDKNDAAPAGAETPSAENIKDMADLDKAAPNPPEE